MAFTSLAFLAFFPAVFALAHLAPGRWRAAVLLAASLFFYLSFPNADILLFLATAGSCYGCALWMAGASSRGARRLALWLCLACNVGILFAVKYWAFTAQAVNSLLAGIAPGAALPAHRMALPVGISFYTFQALGYVVDVYRGAAPERKADRFALFLGFFPLLLSGPIERAGHLLPQLAGRIAFRPELAVTGMRLILWGLFKKLVIANNLAPFVDRVFADPQAFDGPRLALAALAYGYQLFCDFSGYCDIAVGCARLLGIELVQNFRQPYHARSVRDFWRRWHISLSTWFRDYLYIPMGGGRGRPLRVARNLLVVFLVCGLWHGANWTFLVWGGLHGLYLALERLLRSRDTGATDREPAWLRGAAQAALTYALVHFAWIFFRADSLDSAFLVVSGLASGWSGISWEWSLPVAARWVLLESALPAIALCEAVMVLEGRGRLEGTLTALGRPGRFLAYSALAWWIAALGNFGNKSFIYFAF